MKKVLTSVLTILMSLALCAAAFAARKQFSEFSLDIPDGWESTEHTDDKGVKTAVLTHAGKKITLTIGLEPLEGKTLKQKAEEFAGKVGATVEDLGDDVLGILIKGADGTETRAVMAETGDGKFMGAAVTGNAEDPEVEKIIDSME